MVRLRIDRLWPIVGRRVRNIRNERGISQQMLADLCDRSRVSITNLEAGRQRFMLDEIVLIARALGVSVRELVDGF